MKSNPLYIFCGGGSRRMGQDKALLMVKGETLLERHIRRGKQIFSDVTLLPGQNRYTTTIRALPDTIADSGPLGGLLAALIDSENRYEQIAVIPVDVPFLSPETLKALSESGTGKQADALLLRSGGRVQPLAGVYRTGLASDLRPFFESGQRMVMKFVESLQAEYFDVAGEELRNINYPADLPQP